MPDVTIPQSDTLFSHSKASESKFLPGGLRDFFVYKDLGVASATKGNSAQSGAIM